MTPRPQEVALQLLQGMGEQVPIDVHALLQAHRIVVRRQPLEDAVSGMVVIKHGRAIIGLNERHHPHRQRFTLAHELGHVLLHATDSPVFVDTASLFFRAQAFPEDRHRQEREANAFAAALLMPEPLLRTRIPQPPLDALDEGAVRRLAAQFEVSVHAMTIRLTTLGLLTL